MKAWAHPQAHVVWLSDPPFFARQKWCTRSLSGKTPPCYEVNKNTFLGGKMQCFCGKPYFPKGKTPCFEGKRPGGPNFVAVFRAFFRDSAAFGSTSHNVVICKSLGQLLARFKNSQASGPWERVVKLRRPRPDPTGENRFASFWM